MKKSILSLIVLMMIAFGLSAQKSNMTNKKMAKIFKDNASKIEGDDGAWIVHYEDHILLSITDEQSNRMRIFTPIVETTEIESREMMNMLKANFHSALDAKYSVYEGFIVSVFTHPLKELSKDQVVDAMIQVVTLAENFGTTYSSTDMIFGGQEAEAEMVQDTSTTPDKRI